MNCFSVQHPSFMDRKIVRAEFLIRRIIRTLSPKMQSGRNGKHQAKQKLCHLVFRMIWRRILKFHLFLFLKPLRGWFCEHSVTEMRDARSTNRIEEAYVSHERINKAERYRSYLMRWQMSFAVQLCALKLSSTESGQKCFCRMKLERFSLMSSFQDA